MDHPPLIQLALDQLDLDEAETIAIEAHEFIDIFEVGTPCLKYNGIAAVQRILKAAAGKPVLADLKTMDAGQYEAEPFYKFGASICTVLGVASTLTIQGVVRAAHLHGKKAQVDLIGVNNPIEAVQTLAGLGADIIGIHTGIDNQKAGETPFEDLRAISSLGLSTSISVAGGLGPETARTAMDLGADIIVVGSQITSAADPRTAAQAVHQALR